MTELLARNMIAGLEALDRLLTRDVSLLMGGGGAMLLAHSFPLATSDIDAIPKGISNEELKPLIEQVAAELDFPVDWLNPWFASFTHVLPNDYGTRLIEVFRGQRLVARALGTTDLLIMKCFAHREKDVAHARFLIRSGANIDSVQNRIEELASRKIPGTDAAFEFLDRVLELEAP